MSMQTDESQPANTAATDAAASADSAPPADALAPRLRPAVVGMRSDLEIHRHVFRGVPSYVIRDPLTLAVHRVSAEDYQVVATLSGEKPLGEVFEEVCKLGVIDADDEESFYRFILSLHSLGFLNLPVQDNSTLYERREKKRQAKRTAKLMGFLFLQIPLWNPDAFLARTQHLVSWAFTRWAVAFWMVVVGCGLALLVSNWTEFFQPLGTIFTPERIAGLWITLVGMKVLHEFGHAYTCRIRGGEVPEMGVFLLAGTPAAYVDATSSWGFTDRKDRLAVVLAGVYVELFIAALAVFAWAVTDSVTVRIMAFDVVLVAGVATVLANLNPLMRFDGYYLASDLLEIPNLRGTSQSYTLSLVKRAALGTPVKFVPYGRWTKAFFVLFGTASSLYKITIVLGISALLATKAVWLGVGLATFYVGTELFKTLRGIGRFLIHSEEAAASRLRAAAVALAVFAVVPALVVLVPVPRSVKAAATVAREHEVVQYPSVDGFLESVAVSPGDTVEPSQVIATVRNDGLATTMSETVARLRRSSVLALAAVGEDQSEVVRRTHELEADESERDRLLSKLESLKLSAASGGEVIDALGSSDVGRYVVPTEPIATLGSGEWTAPMLVPADAISIGLGRHGDVVVLSPTPRPPRALPGVV
ncbi:MAG: hypothetical protein AAGF47_11230, partial [Planctomycetota bacterium]